MQAQLSLSGLIQQHMTRLSRPGHFLQVRGHSHTWHVLGCRKFHAGGDGDAHGTNPFSFLFWCLGFVITANSSTSNGSTLLAQLGHFWHPALEQAHLATMASLMH